MSLALVVLATALSGCAAPTRVVEPQAAPQSLAEVNAELAAAPWVTVWFADGETFEDVSGVEVSPTEVRFVLGGEPVAVPVDRVEQITTRTRGDAGRGAAIGSTPGLVLAGVGLAGAAAALGSEGPFFVAVSLLGIASVGGALALVGGIVGGVGGRSMARGDAVRLYRAPVGRYLVTSPATSPVR